MKLSFLSILFVIPALVLGGISAPSQNRTQPGAPATAQPRQTPTPPATATPQDTEDSGEVIIRLVRVPATVVDKKGVPVAGLKAEDFQVFEDKQPQQFEIISETAELEKLPIYVGVLMDTSYSTAGKLKFEQEAAMNFIYTVTRLRKDKVAFVTFDDDVNLRQDFTADHDLLYKAVNSVKKPGNQTSLYDAVWQFCDEKMRNVGGGRRALVIITDGDDTYSRATLADAIDIAQRTDTIIFAISTKGGFTGSAVPGVEAATVKDSGDRDLVKLSEETGGRAFFTGDMLALEQAFNKIGKEIRSQYIITYKPTNEKYDGSYRRIDVRLARKGDGFKVRAKRGYRAVKTL